MVLNIIPTITDEVMVLTTMSWKRATKVHTPTQAKPLPYNAGATFEWRAEPVSSLHDIHELLKRIAPDPRQFIIRGVPKEPTKDRVNKAVRVKVDQIPDWLPAKPGHRWASFDVDHMQINWSADNVIPVVEAARRRLPADFHKASCVYQFSASAGLRWDEASLHLWFWFDRPFCDYSAHDWAKSMKKDKAIDGSFFNPVQSHYTADPVFLDGFVDPLPGVRLGLLKGDSDVVRTPDEWLDYGAWERLRDQRAAEREAALPPLTQEDADAVDHLHRYALAALNSAVADIRSQPASNRHNTLRDCAFAIGGYVGSKYIDRRTVEVSLSSAIRAALKDEPERWEDEDRCIRQLLDAGIAKPRIVRKLWKIPWVKTNDEGKPSFCVENTEVLLAHYGATARYNLMTHREEITLKNYSGASDRRQNASVAQIKEIARRHGFNSPEILNDHLTILVANNHFHPVADWIKSKEWDGISRLDQLFDSLEREDKTADHRALMFRIFTAWASTGARAALVNASAMHGVASQFVFVLQGPGGKNKTRWIMSLVPEGSEWAREGVTLDPQSKDSVQQATSNWLVELGELDATLRRDMAALKAFLTNRTDTYRVAFDRKAETIARRTFYAGSVNEQCFLQDDTGNRRFAVLAVVGCDPEHGVDMQQFWAEAATLPPIYLTQAEESALEESNRRYEAPNPMADLCAAYWTKGDKEAWVTVREILNAVDHERNWTMADQVAASKALRNKMKIPSKMAHGGVRLFHAKRKVVVV